MKYFLKTIILILITFCAISCTVNDDNKSETLITKATIILKKTNGDFASGITVYAYDQSTWQVIGDNTLFATGQTASDSSGNAIFSNIEYPTIFTEINNNQNTFRFSAHYKLDGINKIKVTPITFNKGDQKTQTMILD